MVQAHRVISGSRSWTACRCRGPSARWQVQTAKRSSPLIEGKVPQNPAGSDTKKFRSQHTEEIPQSINQSITTIYKAHCVHETRIILVPMLFLLTMWPWSSPTNVYQTASQSDQPKRSAKNDFLNSYMIEICHWITETSDQALHFATTSYTVIRHIHTTWSHDRWKQRASYRI